MNRRLAQQLIYAIAGIATRSAAAVRSKAVQGRDRLGIAWFHAFDLEGHPKATKAYAWSSPIEGSDKRRFDGMCPDTKHTLHHRD